MKTDRILNTALIEAISSVGHTQTLVIGDAGLPVPKQVRCIDLSVVRGVPRFRDVLEAVASEMVVEKVIFAEEARDKNPELEELLDRTLPMAEKETVLHETFKQMTKDAVAVVRTGECTPFANVILVGGVNF